LLACVLSVVGMLQGSPGSTLFPYTTLFRSVQIGHVPVGHHEVEVAVAQLLQAHGAVLGLVDVLETQIFEKILDDPTHGRKIINKDRKSTRLNSSHVKISYAVFCCKKKKRSA